jgi:glycosyltransferase involved in cell wall biosynthesis
MPDDNAEQKPKLPAVSVIIPAYNAADYIGVALASVFGQSYTDFEVIVINDGSTDSERLELAIGPYLSRIIYLKQQNRGPSAARNLGIQHARGEYLAFLDSDDSWLPEYLTNRSFGLRVNRQVVEASFQPSFSPTDTRSQVPSRTTPSELQRMATNGMG